MGTWSPTLTNIASQMEDEPLPPVTISYTPGAEDGQSDAAGAATAPTVTGYTVEKIDDLPSQVVFTTSSAGVTVSAPDLIGYFAKKTRMVLKMVDDSSKTVTTWEEVGSLSGSVKDIYEYHPPSPAVVTKSFRVTANLDTGGTRSETFTLTVQFNHSPGVARLKEFVASFREQLSSKLK